VNDDWYGAVHCWQETNPDGKRKSNLMLTIFVPGNEFLHNMVSKLVQANQIQQAGGMDQVKQMQAKSYTKNFSIWYRTNNLVVSFYMKQIKSHDSFKYNF
jgi:hypothetical protein